MTQNPSMHTYIQTNNLNISLQNVKNGKLLFNGTSLILPNELSQSASYVKFIEHTQNYLDDSNVIKVKQI